MRSRGFTLLEVLVSLAILALALGAIAGINATAFEDSNYSKYVTTATLLARSKMIDIEEKLRKDGLPDQDKEWDGTFEEEGYPGIKWLATSRKIEVDVGQLLGGLFGGEVSSDSLPDQMQSFLGALKGDGPKDLTSKVGSSDLSKMLGGGAMELMYKQVGDMLGHSIREVTLEITWGKKNRDEESIKFVQYVTTTGRLAAPQGLSQLSTGQPNPNDPNAAANPQNPTAAPPPRAGAPGAPAAPVGQPAPSPVRK
jgi:general secretion pathway protein I